MDPPLFERSYSTTPTPGFRSPWTLRGPQRHSSTLSWCTLYRSTTRTPSTRTRSHHETAVNHLTEFKMIHASVQFFFQRFFMKKSKNEHANLSFSLVLWKPSHSLKTIDICRIFNRKKHNYFLWLLGAKNISLVNWFLEILKNHRHCVDLRYCEPLIAGKY